MTYTALLPALLTIFLVGWVIKPWREASRSAMGLSLADGLIFMLRAAGALILALLAWLIWALVT